METEQTDLNGTTTIGTFNEATNAFLLATGKAPRTDLDWAWVAGYAAAIADERKRERPAAPY